MKRVGPKRKVWGCTRRRVAMCVFFGAATSIGSAQLSAASGKAHSPGKTAHTTLKAHISPEASTPAASFPAKVFLKDGSLAVDAHGTDLNQILGEVALDCGMLIEGTIKPVRVFGTYGPGNPQTVLSELLVGLGYNVMMVGVTPEGAPRKLILSERTGPASPPSSPFSPAPYKPEGKPEQAGPAKILPPGAVAHPPPEPPEDDEERRKQNMQRLQRRHPETPQ